MTMVAYVTDASLAQLARRLRQLGYDVQVHASARLEELLESAARDGRTVLTRSARRPVRWAGVSVLGVGADTAAGVRAVVERGEPSGAPLGRCSRCNTALRPRSAFEAHGEVPGRVARRGGPLSSCPDCGQWFWLGTHTARLREWFEAALGHPVEGWPEPPAAAAPRPLPHRTGRPGGPESPAGAAPNGPVDSGADNKS